MEAAADTENCWCHSRVGSRQEDCEFEINLGHIARPYALQSHSVHVIEGFVTGFFQVAKFG